MGVAEYGAAAMRDRFELSAQRLLRNIFRTGLFENPYVDPSESAKIAGNAEFVKAGYEAQQKSVVLLKNKKAALPLPAKTKLYIPMRHLGESHDWFGRAQPARDVFPIDRALVEERFALVEKPEEADAALCFIESPKCLPYIEGKGYLPITLQYRPYTAVSARAQSIAADEGENRGYRGKTNTAENESDLDMVLAAKKAMGDKPVIVIAAAKNPFIAAEFEPAADAVLLHFGVQPEILLDLLSGVAEPSALLPFQMPADMETVESQAEDKERDMRPYKDSCGGVYDFGFGLNWDGVIFDWRTEKYR